jgi:hypothetical protein
MDQYVLPCMKIIALSKYGTLYDPRPGFSYYNLASPIHHL